MMMMKKLIIGAAIFISHVAVFTTVYYGRRRGVWLCESDCFLFGFPFFIALVAYGTLFYQMLTVSNRWEKIALAAAAAVLIATGSAVAGMSVAFNLMGT